MIGIFIKGYIDLSIGEGIQSEKLIKIETDMGNFDKDHNEDRKDYMELKENFEVFKTSVSKDLDYIKKGLGIQ